MRFLFKVAFFLILLFVAVAYFAPSNPQSARQDQPYSILEGLVAIKSAINDMGDFCNRNPKTCETGKLFVSSVKDKALEGARISYEFLNKKLGNHNNTNSEQTENGREYNDMPVETIHTGSIAN